MSPQDPAAKSTPMCSELRCKGMFVPNPDLAEKAMFIPGDTTSWWCEETQSSRGPDRDWVHRTVCTPGRACFRKAGDPS